MGKAAQVSREYPDRPIIGVGALVVEDGKILLVRRATEPLKGEWSLPGGVVEVGETLEQAVLREVREETGIETVVRGDSIAVFERIMPDNDGRVRFHYVLHDYLCGPSHGEARAGDDVDQARWFTRPEVEALPMQSFTRELILRHLQ